MQKSDDELWNMNKQVAVMFAPRDDATPAACR